ncbi:unnamed protein product [Rhizoctonia solani]|uniref:Uncharacterized protein n=1 Tax=Rhizoctonia solani TaxID=456999 RepID=A0A8H3I2D3_9AGAM|nr:unnamed protein product [Rhizoctonia solani]
MALMLRSLASSFNSERTPLPCIDPLSRSCSRQGKAKRTPEPVRASPYPPLKRSSPGYGRSSTPLKRTASLHGGDSLASFQRAEQTCKPTVKRRPSNGPLRPALSLANTLILDPLVCPPPIPLPRSVVHHIPLPKPSILPHLRRRSSLAPEPGSPTALVPRQAPLPSPPCVIGGKKKRESLAQRTLRRQFERTPRGAQVKALGPHVAMRMMSEAEEEAAVAAVVIIDETSDSDDVCMSDSWVQVAPDEMEWSIIDA